MNKILIDYILHLGDDALILSHRNSEWCGHGPVLEQDIAITNIALDLLGQARNFYQYAASLNNDNSTEDSLVYLRKEREFKNCLLVEQPNVNWAHTVLRQFLFSQYQFLLYEKLQYCNNEQIAAITIKAVKEVTYHLRWSSEWVIRLGDGTEESHQKMEQAINNLWCYTGELFVATKYEQEIAEKQIGINLFSFKDEWEEKIKEVFNEATLSFPEKIFMHTGGKNGIHTEYMGYILAELQYMQKTYPNAQW